MKTIKIIVGTYGHKKNNESYVSLIGKDCETDVCSVSDEEAARLIKIGIAKEVGKTVEVKETVTEEPTATVTENLADESLEECTVAELKAKAGNLGLEFKSRATKDELIKLILSAKAEITEDEEADEEPPVLIAVDPE